MSKTIQERKRDDGTSSYDYGFEDGFDQAIERVFYYLKEDAESHARICQELKSKHLESKPFHYKALALIDFKLHLESLFKCNLIESNSQ